MEEVKIYETEVPSGYAETMDRLNSPRDWDVPGVIVDMAEDLRTGNDVPSGQLLAALDWMSFRLGECRKVLVATDSELSAVAHGRPVDKEEAKKISSGARKLSESLRGFNHVNS